MVYTWCEVMHSNTVLRKIHTGDVSKIESLEYTMCITKVYDFYTLLYYIHCMVLLITEFTVKCSNVNAFMEYFGV